LISGATVTFIQVISKWEPPHLSGNEPGSLATTDTVPADRSVTTAPSAPWWRPDDGRRRAALTVAASKDAEARDGEAAEGGKNRQVLTQGAFGDVRHPSRPSRQLLRRP
jgi:hypothetical protein